MFRRPHPGEPESQSFSSGAALALAALTLAGCHKKPKFEEGPVKGQTRVVLDLTSQPITAGKRCIVHLHGKGGKGRPPSSSADGITHLYPSGNQHAWGGLEWRYFPDARFQEIRATLTQSIGHAGCERVLLHGFSNGGAAAAKLYCKGEDLGGRLVGVVVDDPVVDHAVERCKPAKGKRVALYSTGQLAHAIDGWKCSEYDYTCEGGTTVGLSRYAKALGTQVLPSSQRKHEEMPSPKEYHAWW